MTTKENSMVALAAFSYLAGNLKAKDFMPYGEQEYQDTIQSMIDKVPNIYAQEAIKWAQHCLDNPRRKRKTLTEQSIT